ncbi:MAG: hypothetical protein WCO00_05435 [Rhodospirillaceae bacterium]
MSQHRSATGSDPSRLESRRQQVARILRRQRLQRCLRTALVATLSASALTGFLTLLLII